MKELEYEKFKEIISNYNPEYYVEMVRVIVDKMTITQLGAVLPTLNTLYEIKRSVTK